VLTSVTNTLFDDPFAFDESVVKGNLDEILLMLVALRDSDTHGKGLMEDLETVFDADLSPGTVYPRLHDLDDDDLLRVQELVRTKEYRIDDDEDARDRIEEAMRQHLALGFFFYAARDEL
jgi:DNA-binding PadR family transcriptional regulator